MMEVSLGRRRCQAQWSLAWAAAAVATAGHSHGSLLPVVTRALSSGVLGLSGPGITLIRSSVAKHMQRSSPHILVGCSSMVFAAHKNSCTIAAG